MQEMLKIYTVLFCYFYDTNCHCIVKYYNQI